ncbi:cellulase family glycosylhydrolase [Paenibacillus sp. FSL P4-0081]|jgi:endoglucanase|uniref:cellulase family glycosylhydrolase n=1 Tax=Paenibacillus sp. FSL P4-0081 TaxID=1536769 RepID=UPI0007C72C5A|nr:cellulase family glycosylhydrolase [Paenibacillus sp. FSL P4-0081]
MKLKRSFFITCILLLAVMVTAVPAQAESQEKKSALQAYVESLGPGWNLGNTFEASGDETSWGNPAVTQAFIRQLAEEGYKSIRIPVTWKHRMGDAPDYAIRQDFMARIQEVVDWSLAANLHVIINLHHDSNWVMNMAAEHDEVLARFNAAWTQIAGYFKNYPDSLMFESLNEPRFSDDWSKNSPEYFTMLDELNVSFHTIVRHSGGNNKQRPLVLSTLTAAPTQARLDALAETIKKLNDDRLIATFHYYGYYAFSVNLGGSTTFDTTAREDLIQAFDRAYDAFTAKGIPVIVGEFGLLGFDKSLSTVQHGEILKFFEYVTYYAYEKKMPLMLWDNGQHFDRRTLKWVDEELHQVMKQGWKGRSSNAETDSVYILKDAEMKDTAIPLNLNGNTFTALLNQEQALVKGTDYELEGDNLILKSALLQKLITQKYGINAVLTARFSAGADWRMNLIYYDTPSLISAQAPEGIYTIPVWFNGDSLATLEAVYTAGGTAGPNDWTPFKEYYKSFYPDYTTGEIKFTDEFWKEVKDGEVQLKMHFRSGAVIPYTITKTGSQIVGVSVEDAEKAAALAAEEADGQAIEVLAESAEPASTDTAAANSVENSAEAVQPEEASQGSDTLMFLLAGSALIVVAAAVMYRRRAGRR